jgi:para-nitrobenzyl esterase
MIMKKTLMKKGKSFGEMSLTKLPTTGAYGTAFLPDDILPALENGKASHVDIMVGSCRHDGRASAIANPLPKLKAIKMMNKFVGGMSAPTKEGRKEILEKYKANMPEESSYIINEQIQTDALYRMRARKAASIHSRTSASKTYVYQFNWESPVADGKLGAIHGLEIPFAFDNLKLSSELIGNMSDIESAQPLASAMSDVWVSFAQNGKPVSDSLPDWPDYDEETRKTMFFDTNCKIVSDPDSEMRKIWAD